MKRQKRAVNTKDGTCVMGLTGVFSPSFPEASLLPHVPFCHLPIQLSVNFALSTSYVFPPSLSASRAAPHVPACTHPHEPADWDLLINVALPLRGPIRGIGCPFYLRFITPRLSLPPQAATPPRAHQDADSTHAPGPPVPQPLPEEVRGSRPAPGHR